MRSAARLRGLAAGACFLMLASAPSTGADGRQRDDEPELTPAASSERAEARSSAADAEAELKRAASLEHAGQLSAAAARYLRIVRAGPGPRWEEALAALLNRSELLPALLASGGLGEVAVESVPRGLRAEVLHQLAIEAIRRGQAEAARRALSQLPERPADRYLLALLLLRQGDVDGARRQLLASLSLAERAGESPVAELATLALARVESARGAPGAAASLYGSVPPRSAHFFRARQELAWTLLELKDPQAALAQSEVLHAPWLTRYYRPDGELVEAAALMLLCRAREARARAFQSRSRLTADWTALTSFLRHRPDVRLYYVEAMASAAGRSRALPAAQVRALLADPSFRRVFSLVRQLQHERQLLLGDDALRAELSAELDGRLIETQRQAGETVRRVLSGVRAEVGELRLRAEEILFDTEPGSPARALGSRGADVVSSTGPGTGTIASTRRGDAKRAPSVRDGSQLRWPFTGEYWSDEVPFLRASTPSRCPAR